MGPASSCSWLRYRRARFKSSEGDVTLHGLV